MVAETGALHPVLGRHLGTIVTADVSLIGIH
jgi:hypothetical protein